MTTSDSLAAINAATQRVHTTISAMPEAAFAEPSVLPDWSRAHVVAHLGLNGAGIARAFEGLTRGELVAMYDSQESRNDDIETWAALPVAELRARFEAALSAFEAAAAGVPEESWTTGVPRVIGGDLGPARELLTLRLREVEIHHCDLGLDYQPIDWPGDFTSALLDMAALDHAEGPGLHLDPDDLEGHWLIGPSEDAPLVTGPAAYMAWWLIGRGNGEGLTPVEGALPTIGAWR